MSATDAQNAALHLENLVLEGGWVVGPPNRFDGDHTGGAFSVTYIATRGDGSQGFLKVLDLAQALASDDLVDTLSGLTAEFRAERNLCEMCGTKRLSRVVTAITHGEVKVPNFVIGTVPYIIFELATHDVRVALGRAEQIDTVVKLEYAHSLATGVRQLHQIGVAHQDIKPSNILVFPKSANRAVGKIGDLGRAYREDVDSPHDHLLVPGDRSYAPPEQQYRHQFDDPATRRFAADLYQLGSLITFMFTGRTMNTFITINLARHHRSAFYGDSYQSVIPYLDEAYENALQRIESELPPVIADRLARLIRYLCEPDAALRGHPAARQQPDGSNFSLERTVAELDLLVRIAARQAQQ